MDDYAAYLAEEANSDIAAIHQFRILYDPDQGAFHFFFEGEEDSLFYMPEARRRISQKETYIYDCGGKKNVIEVRDSIKTDGYKLDGCLFFVDRDYDDYLGVQAVLDDYTYITDNYSIENELSSISAVRVLLMDVLRLSRADPEFVRIESRIVLAYTDFYKELRALVSWILAATEENCKPNLKNTAGLKGIVSMVNGKPVITKKGFIDFKKQVSSSNKLPAMATLIKWRRRLDLSCASQWARGKYDLWFFKLIMLVALDEANLRRLAAGAKAISVPSSLREGRFFELLGGRLPPSSSLQKFYTARLH